MLVILDRDGVINVESEAFIKSPAEWLPIPGSLEAIAKLKKAGCRVVIATNQSGIARGLYSEKMLALIHQKMCGALKEHNAVIDGIYYCPHHPEDKCACRKPEPGLFLQIAKDFNVDLTSTWIVGDSERDIQAALKVGAKPILVLTGNGRKTLADMSPLSVPVFADLIEAVNHILDFSEK